MDPRTPTSSPDWHRRLHAALMPDYTPAAAAFWWVAVLAGAAVIGWSLYRLSAQPWVVWGQVALAGALAIGSGLFPIRVPGTRQSFTVGEVFVFLVLLALGPAAAVLVASGETAVGAFRSSKRLTSRLATPAITALALGTTGGTLTALLPAGADTGAALLLAAVMACGLAYFAINSVMLSGLLRLKRGEPFLRLADLGDAQRWIGLSFAASAAMAALLFVTWRSQGAAVLGVMLPLLALLLLALHLFYRHQESGQALQAVQAAAAEAAAQHLQALQASERRFHNAFTHAGIGMALLAFDGRILQANPAMGAMLDREPDALAGLPVAELVDAADRPRLMQALGLEPGHGFEPFALELRGLRPDGAVRWLALHCSFFTDPDADEPCLILQAQDVTARREAEAGLALLAFHDPLTGLPNRRRFMECLVGALARARADPRHAWAVMFIDFDRFKLVNDSLGHRAGDQLLQQLARRIQERLRPSDVVARLGGDEFAVLVADLVHERDAVLLAERLLESLRRPFVVSDIELTTSASIGITFSAMGYDSADDVLRDADTAMYKAKAAGKACYALFDSGLHRAVSERLRLEGELRSALDKDQLSVVYQPVFRLGAGAPRLHGFEALVRWRHPSSGTLLPADFLPVAEESGLMLQLSDFVLHTACHQLRQWQDADPALRDLQMSINLSAHDLTSPALVARVGRALIEAGVKAEHLTLEITENILMSRIDGVLDTLAGLRRLGLRLAVDDFGTGYSSLSHLSRLPIDSLKIDRSFVGDLAKGSAESAVVGAIIQLGGTLHKTVIAEGIESGAQLTQLAELGCGFGQGFHFAQPLSGPEAGDWLRSQLRPLH